MTPAEAAREVAALLDDVNFFYTEDDAERRVRDLLSKTLTKFAELLDRTPVVEVRTFSSDRAVRYIPASPCGSRCPDGIACPLADEYPGAH